MSEKFIPLAVHTAHQVVWHRIWIKEEHGSIKTWVRQVGSPVGYLTPDPAIRCFGFDPVDYSKHPHKSISVAALHYIYNSYKIHGEP